MTSRHSVSYTVEGPFLPHVLGKIGLGEITDLIGVKIRTGKRDISNPPTEGPWTNEIDYQESTIKHAEQFIHGGKPQDILLLTLEDGRVVALYKGMFNMLQFSEKNGDPKYYYIDLSINDKKLETR
jgi:hypothetical protein